MKKNSNALIYLAIVLLVAGLYILMSNATIRSLHSTPQPTKTATPSATLAPTRSVAPFIDSKPLKQATEPAIVLPER